MKQIDIIRTYAQKRCLVIDPEPELRAHVKRLLTDFGVNETDTAGNAEEAIDLCQKRQYDMLISEYNLGPGKNGQQLLEELRQQNLLKLSALFIVLTAEAASHDILHALENSPDDLVQKPFNKASLRARLDQAVLKNEYLAEVQSALDDKRIDKAIERASQLVQKPHRFRNDARRLLAELYLNTHRADEAEAVYSAIAAEAKPLWLTLGQARVHMLRKEYELAEAQLQAIIHEQPYCVSAIDLLATVYELTHRPDLSQQSLLNAIKLSPRAPTRQRDLGRLSLSLDDDVTAVHAYRSAIRYAKNSCYEAADDLINLADGLVKMSVKESGGGAKKLLDEALNNLHLADKRYGKHPIVAIRNRLSEASLEAQRDNESRAKQLVQDALDLFKQMPMRTIANTSPQLCIDCAKAFMNHACYDEGEAILQELMRINRDEGFSIKIDKLLREPQTKEGIAFAARSNKAGIEHYERGHIVEAARAFKMVLRELPNHVGLNLNLIQALLTLAKTNPLADTERALLSSCFRRVGTVPSEAPHYKRYQYLKKRYEYIIGASSSSPIDSH